MSSDRDTKLVSSRLKFLAEAPVAGTWGSEPTGDSNDIRCIRAADFDRNSHRVDPSRWPLRSVEDADRHELRIGDLLIEKSGGGATQPVGAVILFDRADRAVCSNFVARLRPLRNTDSRYLTYLHESLYRGNGTVPYVKQTTGIQNLDLSAYLGQSVSVHDPGDQPRIADFLDQETERIDALVDKKRRLIDLLEEKRTATITQAVTKGLDPTAPMKHSNIPWIGQMPTSWRVAPIRRISVFQNSNVDKKTVDGELPVLLCNYTNVYYGSYLQTLEGFTPASATSDEIRRFRLKKGTVIITKDSESADDIGVPAYVVSDLDALCGYHLTVLEPAPSLVTGEYLYWVLESSSLRQAFETYAQGVTRFGLTRDGIGSPTIPVPSIREQRSIVDHLRTMDRHVRQLVEKVEAQLTLLAEYREALITAAVTGEVDVDTFENDRHMEEATS